VRPGPRSPRRLAPRARSEWSCVIGAGPRRAGVTPVPSSRPGGDPGAVAPDGVQVVGPFAGKGLDQHLSATAYTTARAPGPAASVPSAVGTKSRARASRRAAGSGRGSIPGRRNAGAQNASRSIARQRRIRPRDRQMTIHVREREAKSSRPARGRAEERLARELREDTDPRLRGDRDVVAGDPAQLDRAGGSRDPPNALVPDARSWRACPAGGSLDLPGAQGSRHWPIGRARRKRALPHPAVGDEGGRRS
jgi:hypothetical protein